MPYNEGTGVFTPAVTFSDGTTATAEDQNTQDSDIASGLTQAMTRGGYAPATANWNMGGYKLTSLGAGSASGDSVNYGQLSSFSFSLTNLPSIATNTVIGNVSGGTSTPSALTKAQLTALINAFTSSLSGAVPASPGGTSTFLRSDASFAPIPATGVANGLKIINGNAAPTTTTTVTANSAILLNSSGAPVYLSSISVTLSSATSGAGGLDTGTIAASTWYYVWLIWNGTAVSAIYSLSSTAPTLPSGYTFYLRVGAVITNGSSQFLQVLQLGSFAQYVVLASGTITALPVMATGSAALWTSIAVGAYVPPTATRIRGTLFLGTGSNGGAVAPNSNYTAYTDAPVSGNWTGLAGGESSTPFDMILESSNIYWYDSQSAGKVKAVGWVDSVPAN